MQHLRCTLQVTIGILLVLAAACGEDKAVPTSGPAGLVISVQGDVRATRPGQATRALAVHDTVFGEDTLVTGKASSVEVELTHNGARWQLGADSERRVDTSVAWRAKQQKTGLLAGREEIKTGAAGRNTTREAAESRETLLEEDSDREEAAELEQAVEGQRERKTKPVRETSKTSEGNASGSGSSDSRRVQPLLQESLQLEPPPPPPAPKAEAEEGMAADDAPGASVVESVPAPAPASAKLPAAPASPLRSHVLAVTTRCHGKHGGRGTLTVAITVKGGKASHLRVKGPDALGAVRSCVTSALQGTALPAGGPLTESIPLR